MHVRSLGSMLLCIICGVCAVPSDTAAQKKQTPQVAAPTSSSYPMTDSPRSGRIVEKKARETITAVELDKGDELRFKLFNGTVRRIVLENTFSDVQSTTLADLKTPQRGAKSEFRAHCRLRIDGTAVELTHWYGNQFSFDPPVELMGLRIWFDATQDLFDYMSDLHECKPRKHARFALQDATGRVCSVLLHPWCQLPEDGLKIERDCYDGFDCWLGPYFGAIAHGGLDINHPPGSPLWTPIDIDEQWLFDNIAKGANNNRWRGIRRWPDGSTWVLQSHHLVRLLVPEHQPLAAGTHYAETAGMLTGSHPHTHFMFFVREPGAKEGEEIALDPWILFWQMQQDRAATTVRH